MDVRKVALDVVAFLRTNDVDAIDVVLTGDERDDDMLKLQDFISAAEDGKRFVVVTGYIPGYQMMVFSRDQNVAYSREDVGTILPDFRRWFQDEFLPGRDDTCLTCAGDAGSDCGCCATCRAKTCAGCLPRFISREPHCPRHVFTCPCCRKRTPAMPVIDRSVPPVNIWTALHKSITRCSGSRAGCIVASAPTTVIVDARVGSTGRVILTSEYYDVAIKCIGQPGCIVGVGEAAGLPDGTGFIIGHDGRAHQLVNGWRYAKDVFLRDPM